MRRWRAAAASPSSRTWANDAVGRHGGTLGSLFPLGYLQLVMKKPSLVLLALPLLANVASAATPDFVVNFLPADVQLNPIHSYTTTEAQIYTAIYEGLVVYDPLTLEPQPGVAERWEVSDDRRTYTFYLRDDAKYWNGDRVSAQDFRETWLKLLRPDTEAAYASLFDIIEGAQAYRNGDSTDRESVGIRARSAGVLEVTLEHPASHFLRVLCHHSFVVVHPDLLEIETWQEPTEIIGNGPFVINDASDDEMVLARNESYWDSDRIELDTLRFVFSDDYLGITEQFNIGEIQWVRGAIDIPTVRYQDTIVVNPLFATTYYQFNAASTPFDDWRIRRALALLIPWGAVRDEAIQFLPSANLVPSIPYYPDVEGILERDEERAVELIEAAGIEQVPDFTITIPGGEENQRVAGLMKDAWEPVLGNSIAIEQVLYPEYFDLIEDEQYTVGTVSWIGDFADPLTFLEMWTSGSNLNNSAYSNREYDSIVRKAMEQSGVGRYETLAEAEELLLWDAIVLPISHSPAINLIDLTRVDGWYPNPLDVHPFKFIAFSDGGTLRGIASR